MATIAPPAMRSTSDAARERSESAAPRTVSAAGELAVTPRKKSFGDAFKGAFARRRSSSAGRSRCGQGLPDEAMEGLKVVGGESKGTGLLRRKPSTAVVWTKAI